MALPSPRDHPAPGSRAISVMLTSDGLLLFAARAVRTFAYGFLSVILGLYLAALGLRSGEIGLVFSGALAGGALMTVVITAVADRAGRRRVLALGAVLMALAGAAFAVSDRLVLLTLAAVIGTISPSGGEVGPFLSLEQAILPQTSSSERRTTVFAWYNLVGSLAAALGSLAAGVPSLLQATGVGEVAAYRVLVWAYAAAALVLLGLYTRLSPAVEVEPAMARARGGRLGLHRSRRIVVRMSLLFSLDAFGGGFLLQSFVAYWLALRFDADPAILGTIFFGANLLAGLSFLAAARVAERIGLINTMVFTHLPSNVLVLLFPFMPTLPLAVLVWLVRSMLSQMDVPTRQSYTMAVVDPDERSAAAGFTSVARNAAAALSPGLAGYALGASTLGLPFLVGGGLKIVYDLALFWMLRRVKPPEERVKGG